MRTLFLSASLLALALPAAAQETTVEEVVVTAAPYAVSLDSVTSSIDVVLPKIVGSHLADASVSTREMIDEIRAMLPCLAVTDEELVNRIAAHAIRIGLAVTFDSRNS